MWRSNGAGELYAYIPNAMALFEIHQNLVELSTYWFDYIAHKLKSLK